MGISSMKTRMSRLVDYHAFEDKSRTKAFLKEAPASDWSKVRRDHSHHLQECYTRKPTTDADIESERIENAIEESKRILQLRVDWDDDQSPHYSQDTWQRAITFLRELALHAHSSGITGLGVPSIAPSEGGSVDIFWQKDDLTMLVNIPSDPQRPATYYGKKKGSELSSTFELGGYRSELITWLTALK